jgi:hypothetical protein
LSQAFANQAVMAKRRPATQSRVGTDVLCKCFRTMGAAGSSGPSEAYPAPRDPPGRRPAYRPLHTGISRPTVGPDVRRSRVVDPAGRRLFPVRSSRRRDAGPHRGRAKGCASDLPQLRGGWMLAQGYPTRGVLVKPTRHRR